MFEFDLPPFAMLVAWAAWIFQATVTWIRVRRFAKRVQTPTRRSFARYRPKATVIVPFKGVDDDLPACIRTLCTQDYPDYNVAAVVESEDDPATAVLREELAKYPERSPRVIVAGVGGDVGQKVHNQLAVLDAIDSDCGDDEVWVFADSDAIPGGDWLGALVGPLREETVGVTTGYRWLVPEAGPNGRVTIWSKLASVMNSSVATMMGRPKWDFAWGGSMAMRVSVARQGELRERLSHSVTDDYTVSKMARDLGLLIWFCRDCLVTSPVHFTWATLTNFAYRQYAITRISAPEVYWAAFGFMALFAGCWAATWGYLAYTLAIGSTLWTWPVAVLAIIHGLHQLRAAQRREVVRRAFGKHAFMPLRDALWWDRWGTWLYMGLHGLLVLRAMFGATFTWRGIRYRMRSVDRVERLAARRQ